MQGSKQERSSFLFHAITQLSSFIRIPSISADNKYHNDIQKCATWLADHLHSINLENVKIIPTEKHPIVYADWLHAPGKKTLLIYGHYDVQPVDPLIEWHHPPFSGVFDNEYIYGRGASDDKGQLFAHIKALEYFLNTDQQLPVNIKCILDGAEEIGSPGMESFLNKNVSHLRSDVAVISDMRIPAVNKPAITYSLRGMLSLELEVKGQKQDLHSGTFGGAVRNPLQVLCEMISCLHNTDGKIAIPGFYDSVIEKSFAERNYMKTVGQPDHSIIKDAGAEISSGENGYSVYERTTIRPSLSVNGITGGYQGDGPKAVIASKASAKISFRLVPDQQPDSIENLFRQFTEKITPPGINCIVKKNAAANPVVVPVNNQYVRAASAAYKKAFKNETVFLASGGTIPIVNLLQEKLKIPAVLMGFALPTDNLHGPNERFSVSNFYNGIKTSIHFLGELGRF